MEFYQNVLSEDLADTLYKYAVDAISGIRVTPQPKIWTNAIWDEAIVKDSSVVICIEVPELFFPRLIQDFAKLNSLEFFNPAEDAMKTPMLYLWTRDSYIPLHNDQGHKKAVTIYLNRDWQEDDGGIFQWRNANTEEWSSYIPAFNTMVLNNTLEDHQTTPVKTNKKFRCTLQAFFK